MTFHAARLGDLINLQKRYYVINIIC